SHHASPGPRLKSVPRRTARKTRPGYIRRTRELQSRRRSAHTKDENDHPGPAEASQSIPTRRNQNRIQLQIPRRIQRTKHKPAPISADRTDTRKPDPATNPIRHRHTSSAHSDKEPSPSRHTKPRSIPNRVRRPSARSDTAPSPGRHLAATPAHNPDPPTMCHGHPDFRFGRNFLSCVSALQSCGSYCRDPYSTDPNHPAPALRQP